MAVRVRRSRSAREYHTQQTHYLYRKVAYDTPQIQAATSGIVYLGVLPANCLKMETIVRINTTFDGLLVVGSSADNDRYVTTADVPADVADTYVVSRDYGTRSTVDLPVYVALTTGSTVGEAEIWLTYLPAK